MNLPKNLRLIILSGYTSLALPATGAPGSLDTSFHSSGVATTSFGGVEKANAVAVSPDGKIIVAGSAYLNGNGEKIAVLRYNSNGSLDKSFDNDGGLITDIEGGSEDSATAVAVQPDGKILVAGYSLHDDGKSYFVLIRYNRNGSLDTFFAAGGMVITDISNNFDDRAVAIAIQPNGKILVAGSAYLTNGADFAVVRYNIDGTYDNSFGTGGVAVFDLGAQDVCKAMALQPDGKIVLSGSSNAMGGLDFAVARLTATGTPDNTFSADGKQFTRFNGVDESSSVAILPNGRIVVGGTTYDGMSSADFAIARYTASGTLDPSFSGDGKLTQSIGSVDRAAAMILQPDGKIVIAGDTEFWARPDFAIARFTSAGVPDTTFGTAGLLMIDANQNSTDGVQAIALQKDGRLVIAGFAETDFAIARLNMLVRTDARVGLKSSATTGDNVYNTTGSGQTQKTSVKTTGGKSGVYVKIQNDGNDKDSFAIKGSVGNPKFQVKYFNGKKDVTKAVVAGTFSTGGLAPGATFGLNVQITSKTSKPRDSISLKITGTSVADPKSKDTVKVIATSK